MNTITIENSMPDSVVPMAREALSDSPIYVEHICATLATCGQNLRAGYDQDGMQAFARSASDLDQFIQLFERIAAAAPAPTATVVDAFRVDLRTCVSRMERTLNRQDMIGLSDEIDGRLVPLLRRWGTVSSELALSLSAHAT